jgi:hypothetical protein
MNSIKEVYSDFSSMMRYEPEIINFASEEMTTRQSPDPQCKSKTRGITISLKNYLIYG